MKVSKKSIIISLFAALVLFLGLAFGLLNPNTRKAVAAEETVVTHYFYNQLTDDQKEFYKAMEEMDVQGIFKRDQDYDLVASGHVTQAQLEAYASGDSKLLMDMGAARDAFYTDYAEIFYVDFGYLSLRVTQGSDGKYRAYLGTGRDESYYTQGFKSEADVTSAIELYSAKINELVSTAKNAQPSDAQIGAFGKALATTVEQIREVHKQIALSTVYKLETTCSEGNEGHIRTPYGLLVKGEALCEGYSRTFKAAMDRLGVPCVLVNGAYRVSETRQELHMWTYVRLNVNGNDEWYAVDPTFDDLNLKKAHNGLLETEFGLAYNEDYFLKGASFMNTQHATSPYKSEVEYPFTYPKLVDHNFGSEVSTAHGGIIRWEQEPYNFNANSSTIKVSVFIDEDGDGEGEWCGYQKAAKKGYYLVMRHEGNYLPEQIMRAGGDLSKVPDDEFLFDNGVVKTNSNSLAAWGYVNPIPDLYAHVTESEDGSQTIIYDQSKQTGFEFALTDIPPREYNPFETDLDKVAEMTTYSGDPTVFIARSGLIKTLYGDSDYVPAPHIVKATPALTGKLAIGYSYNVTAEYDQYLELMDGETELTMSVFGMRATGEFVKGTNAVVLEDVVDLSTVTWDRGEGTNNNFVRGGRISFKFTPSTMYAHDNIVYYFNFNLQGENSKKQITPITHVAAYESDACCYKANGFHWKVWAQPQLLENDDLSTEGWVTSDGTDVSETKSRLALIVTSPSKKHERQINDLLESELNSVQGDLDDGGFESFTYNIQLTICKGVVLETYQGVRVSIGFPEGFTYDDSMNGVMFKAYHFIHDAQNNVTGVEELEVTVTPLGLIITCYSFSPFAIVAVKGEAPERTDKTVILSNTKGGKAYADVDGKKSNLFSLKEGEARTVSIKADNGYVIESVKVSGALVEISDSNTMELELAYSSLTSSPTIVEVNFVAAAVKAAEEARGETAVIQQLKGALISVVKKISVKVGEVLEIKADVTAYGTFNDYQWYKGDELLENQTSDTLYIESAELTDAGKYSLKVTSYSISATETAESDPVQVKVSNDSPLALAAKIILIAVAVMIIVFLVAMLITMAVRKSRHKKKMETKGIVYKTEVAKAETVRIEVAQPEVVQVEVPKTDDTQAENAESDDAKAQDAQSESGEAADVKTESTVEDIPNASAVENAPTENAKENTQAENDASQDQI